MINNTIPLNANPNLNVAVKNDAKVSATNERFASSIDFSAYSFLVRYLQSNETIIQL